MFVGSPVDGQRNARFLIVTPIPTFKLWLVFTVIVVSPVILLYKASVTFKVGTFKSTTKVSLLLSVATVTIPVYFTGPIPSATKP